MIIVTRDADINGTHLQGYVRATMNELIEAFGKPSEKTDGYKVSTEWDLKLDFIGRPITVTIYDWKATDLYDPSLPSVEAFRKSVTNTVFTWHVGGKDKEAPHYVHHALEYGTIFK